MKFKNLYKTLGKSVIGRYASYATQLLSMLILARLFSPQDFGAVVSVQVIYVFFQLLSEAGIGPAVINIDKIQPEERNGIYSVTVILGLLSGLIIFLSANLIEIFYATEGIAKIVPYLAFSVFFYSASTYPTAVLLKEQKFYRIAFSTATAEILSSAFSIIALKTNLLEPTHALASKMLAMSLANFLMLYKYSALTDFGRPRLGKKVNAIKPILSFSSYQLGFNFVNYFSRNLDNILVAKILGAASLGIYDKAYQLMRYPLQLITFAITPALQPYLKETSCDEKKAQEIFEELSSKLLITSCFTACFIILFSKSIILILLGDQWLEVSPLISILALSIPVQMIASSSGSFFQALNKPEKLFLSGFLSAIVTVTLVIIGIISRDLKNLSWMIVLAFNINFIQSSLILYRSCFRSSPKKFFIKPLTLILIPTTIYLIMNSK